MNKKNKLLFAIIPSIFTIGVISSVTTLSTQRYTNKLFKNDMISENSLIGNSELNASKDEYPLVAAQANGQNAYLSTKTGPIVYWGDKITSLDWFGAERWTIDVWSILSSPTHAGDWKRAWFNWDYDRDNDILWILTAGTWKTGNINQKLIGIDVKTGNDYFKNSKPDKYTEIPFPANKTDVRFLSVLKSGDVLMYGGASLSPNSNAYLYKKDKNKIETISYTFKDSLDSAVTSTNGFSWYFFNLISIGDNLNIAEFVQFPTGCTSSFDVYGILVDNNLKEVKKGKWTKPQLIANGLEGFNNKQTTPQRDYYYLTNGTVLTVLYNRLVLFDPITTEMKVLRLTDDIKWVQSWTFNASDNLYYKYRDGNIIYKINTTNIQSSANNNLLSPTTYFDISGATGNDVNKYANNYILYNVHGYTGQIMMINSRYKEDPNFGQISQEEILKNKYGLAVAISENKNDQDKGDIKGLLNTENAFLQAANFKIKDGVLKNKLPSEITSSDFEYLNESFLTRNNSVDENGNPKYPQFTKEIDDEKGEIKVQVNLDQIPWFVSNGQMPNDIAPKTLKFESTEANKISTRVTWKNADLDYDFKNTLPSKLTDNDIYRFDPFSINIQSQNIRLNNVSYPNKKYDIVEKNDETGLVKIKTTFEYLPLGVDLKSNNIQTYSEIKEYKIFNSKQKHELVFIGNSGNDTENIKQIPELKELSESNLLPSSFNSTDPSSILKFINTENSSGYPLSKMIFNIIPNDNDGTITITCSLPDGYYPGEQNKIFKKTYTGLNKITDYSFIVNKQSNSSFNKKQYRPSEIDEQDIYEHFIQYKGFNSSDIKLELSPNDENGELNLKLILDGSYPPSVTTNWGFVKENNQYIKSDSIDGFKTTEEYENQYVVKFKDDNGKSLREIKKYTPNQIKDILKATKINDHKLFIDGVEIKNELDFAKNVIESKGTSIPDNWDNQHFGYEIYYNDTNGEITIKLTFKNIPGTESDLVFIQRYTGFAKGNQVPTEDIFSFKTQAQLFVDNQDFKDLLPSDIESQLKDSENGTTFLNKFIGFSSEAYTNGLNNKKYKLEIVSNDIYGYITLKIIFDSDVVTNKDSLLVYTATYNNFLTE
ncbi:lipoprotein 17-related variable surface protein [Malacoplasma iowae]|uniref:Lipoprotein 17-related variable surface protein n=1 Tax=Malacoplasma iowae 695 TaxID=1048830 RepID=A0A6P1LHI1_MALIO|nr:lipoprotein 17-related variable surface protein [Malacoplasma iowae]QHG90100.1 lipoprotein 17-related variable surface protein [Malacoplasma iowae 695]WPL36162.1 lipoprotein 17-related variable surface protein [Malacoplasma iowae]VEU61837.1 Domain of uncharacterised function (DUF1976) [Mycoplasmopsis fermentans]VEU70947.1 Domain of uncharacterised function (DUF1976) [Malacoplasma iowae]